MSTNTQENTTAIVLTDKDKTLPVKNFFEQEHIKARFQEAYNNNREMAMKAMSAVSLECTRTPALLKCTRISLITAALDAASFGLIPNKHSGHAYLIPRGGEVQLEIGYKGYVKKLDEEGWSVEVELVTKEEMEAGKFKELRGTESSIQHEPIRDAIQNEENVVLGYAIAKKVGRHPIYCVMSIKTIMEAAKTNIGKDANGKKTMGLKGVWKSEDRDTDFAEMCKKTLVRRLSKMVPIEIVNEMSSYEGRRDGVDTEDHKPKDVMGDKIKAREQKEVDVVDVEEPEAEVIKPEPEAKEDIQTPTAGQWPVYNGLDELVVASSLIAAAKYMLNWMEGRTKDIRQRFMKDNNLIIAELTKTKATTLLKTLTDKANT